MNDDKSSSTVIPGVSGVRLLLTTFLQLAGKLAGYPFIKVVLDRQDGKVHFINNNRYPFHADYVAEQILGMHPGKIDEEIDAFNEGVYFDPNRRFFFGLVSLQKTVGHGPDTQFYTLETVEVDTMDRAMVEYFFGAVREWIDPLIPTLFKPANTLQETIVKEIDPVTLPRIFSHQLFAAATFIALNPGKTVGRIRAFRSEIDYKRVAHTIEWHDIVVMHRVPDDIPRISGIINANQTTPLSHTNVLASGWKIPNCIQLGIFDRIEKDHLHEEWVEYSVENSASEVFLKKTEAPTEVHTPAWKVNRVWIESPEIANTPILSLTGLRAADRYKYGTKAANLGELHHVISHGSERMLGFYRVARPPRENLLPHLAKFLGVSEDSDISAAVHDFMKKTLKVPRGVAVPFSIQQEFLESSPRIQQAIGKLKMALELDATEVDSLCLTLQMMMRQVRMPDKIRNRIDAEIAKHLPGTSNFVIRSSSNAEDLQGFSAAGIYESISHVTAADKIFESIKEVWASLLSPRSVRLRHQVGISLDDCYMGVIVQEMIESEIGGVLVTTNPSNRADFRNVYMNVSARSVENVVQGSVLPIQMIYNTVEGGGRTMSLGDFSEGITPPQAAMLQKLAFAGRLLQSHFSPDYTFSQPVDIEWLAGKSGIGILQLRPYSE
ncbi:MAG: phosphoenolpyruvate synthase [Cryobacterium sp.]|nr:phosphoenolpyruvate synthase [Oligoflexia bacterium]